jgi:hypothetical protein
MAVEDEEREASWKAGWHTDAEGNRWNLDQMNYEHLVNTINAFRHLKVGPLRKALRTKQREFIPLVISYLERREKAARKMTASKKAKKRANLAKAARDALERFINA